MKRGTALSLIAGAAILTGAALSFSVSRESALPIKGEMADFSTDQAGIPAPDIAMRLPDGAVVTLADKRGKVVLVNLWATWCAPCVEEMPSLDRLQATLGGADFEVVALSLDREGAEKVLPFREKHAIRHLAAYLDPGLSAMTAWRPPGLPVSYLIDRDGVEIGRYLGHAEWDHPDALALIGAVIDDQRVGTGLSPR